jgi:hypothetical protein
MENHKKSTILVEKLPANRFPTARAAYFVATPQQGKIMRANEPETTPTPNPPPEPDPNTYAERPTISDAFNE